MACISKLGKNVRCYFTILMPPLSLCEQAFVHANCGGVTVNDGAFLFKSPFSICAGSHPEFDPYLLAFSHVGIAQAVLRQFVQGQKGTAIQSLSYEKTGFRTKRCPFHESLP